MLFFEIKKLKINQILQQLDELNYKSIEDHFLQINYISPSPEFNDEFCFAMGEEHANDSIEQATYDRRLKRCMEAFDYGFEEGMASVFRALLQIRINRAKIDQEELEAKNRPDDNGAY